MSESVAVPEGERIERAALAALQARKLAALVARVWGANPFYTRKFEAAGVDPDGLGSLASLPLTVKHELIADQQADPPWGTNRTEPFERYTRFHQTSSTTGRPLRWLDTNESWQWLIDCWLAVYRAARVTNRDRVFFPFSFGPFLGFWLAFEAGQRLDALCVPGGGLSSAARLGMIESVGATVVCCTPTYGIRLAQVAREEGVDLAGGPVRVLIVAGEPGGSIPATRARLETEWGARVIDHHGLTEVGPVSYECWETPGGMHLNEAEFLCEVLERDGESPVAEGETGELVVTNLGRTACPLIRYRTGDLVRLRTDPCACGRTFARLDGGILARADDMITVRGVNLYPAAIEAVLRADPNVIEYRATVTAPTPMRSLRVEIEASADGGDPRETAKRVARRIRDALGLSAEVRTAPPDSLPRFEMKSHRFHVEAADGET